jgi:hypothetical protein
MLSGYVVASNSERPIPNATYWSDSLNIQGITDNNGLFKIYLPYGRYCLNFSHVGYKAINYCFEIKSDTVVHVSLSPREINEAKIIYDTPLHTQALLGKTTIKSKRFELEPAFVSEPDVIRTLSLLPGVAGNIKGFSHINVRGGDRGGNLLLLDNTPIQSANHVFGFISTINTDILSEVDFYKGGFPARYGGRISSIIDMQTKVGSKKRFSGKADIGLLYSKVFLEGPFNNNNKTSYVFSARASYTDIFTIPFRLIDRYGKINVSYPGFTFYDGYMKIHHRFSPSNRVSLSYYDGADIFKVVDKSRTTNHPWESEYKYRQATRFVSFNSQAKLASKLYHEGNLSYSWYDNKTAYHDVHTESAEKVISDFSYSNKLGTLSGKSIFKYYLNNKITLNSGLEISFLSGNPVEINIREAILPDFDTLITDDKGRTNAMVYHLFVENDLNFGNLKIHGGLRYSIFPPVRSKHFFEPRLSAAWLFHKNYSAKIGYCFMNQYQHNIINNSQGTGSEIWFLSTNEYPPQNSHLYSFGLFGKPYNGSIEFGIESYFRTMNDLLILNYDEIVEVSTDIWDDLIHRNGIGKSYGFEFQSSLKQDKFYINAAYTLSWSKRKFDDLNHGEWFYNIQDRRHDLNFSYAHQFKKRTLGLTFVLSTGTPVSFPVGYVASNDFSKGYYVYDEINNYRLPLYHRLDISYTREKEGKKGRIKYRRINIYNAYAKQNAVHLHVYNGKVYQYSFFSILPTITWGVKF